jgi:hypothetical protein
MVVVLIIPVSTGPLSASLADVASYSGRSTGTDGPYASEYLFDIEKFPSLHRLRRGGRELDKLVFQACRCAI